MTLYILGLSLFFIPHFFSAVRSREDGRDIRKTIGEAKYMGLYSVITLVGFIAMIIGYAKAPDGAALYVAPHDLHHIAWMIMLPAFILLSAAYMPMGYIKRTAEHPMMLGVLIWAGLHMAMGGDLKQLLLFGSFFAYALISLIGAYKRGTDLKDKPASALGDILAIIVGLLLIGLFMHGGHVKLFGTSPV